MFHLVWLLLLLLCSPFPLFVLFLLCGLLSEVWRFGLFRCEGCCLQLALTSSGSLPVHFRVLFVGPRMWAWVGIPLLTPNFLKRSFILGDSNWKFVQVGYPVDTPTDCCPYWNPLVTLMTRGFAGVRACRFDN